MGKKLCVLVVALIVNVAMVVYAGVRVKTVSVSTTTLSPQTVTKTISCDGVVEASEKLPVFAETACYIDRVVVRKGMYVNKGDVLAYIDKVATKSGGQLSQYDALKLSAMPEEICAPESGILLKVDIDDGQWLEKTTACAVIAPSDSIQVRVAIREKHLPLLHSGLTATVSGDALQSTNYVGTLTDISSTAQSLEGGGTVVEGIVEFADRQEDPSLRIGINVKADIVVETVEEGILIPYEAVISNEQADQFVYVLSNGVAEQRVIGDYKEMSQGLLVADETLKGETVILRPQEIAKHGNARYSAVEARS